MSLLRVKTGQGKGQTVDVSLYESVFNLMESLVPEFDLLGHVRTRTGGALPGISPSNTYRTGDGSYIVIAGNSDPIFRRLMTTIDRDDLGGDPRLASNDGRVAHSAMLDSAISAWTSSKYAGEALALLQDAGVPCGRIYTASDIINDPHYQRRGMILPATLPDGTVVKMPGITPKLSETPGAIRWIGPTLGEHTTHVLHNLGFSEAEIEHLTASGAIG